MPVRTRSANPLFTARTSYCPMGSAINSYLPAWSVTPERDMPVSRFFAVTVAADTTAPVWSVTRPDKLAETWASAISECRPDRDSTTTHTRYLADIIFPPNGDNTGDWSKPDPPRSTSSPTDGAVDLIES